MILERVIRRVHLYMDRSIYNTLGMYRDYRNFSVERLFVAVIAVLLATFVRMALSSLLGTDQPFLIYILAVMVSTWLGGFRTGVLATLLSSTLGIVLFVPQRETLTGKDVSTLVQLAAFLLVSFLMTVLITALLRARRRTEFITERLRKGQHKLDAANREIRNILESISDGFIAVDRHWRFIYINQKAEKVLGRERTLLIGKNIWEEFPAFRGTMFFEKSREAEMGRRPIRFEYRPPALDEWFLVHIYPSRGGFSVYLDGITDIKERERRKDEFVSVASHELKTPVTSIKLFAQVLKKKFKDRGDGEAEQYLEKMDAQLDRLTKLILTLLDVSRIHRGKLQVEKRPFKVEGVIEEVVGDLAYANETHTISVRTEDGVAVIGDRDRIRQVAMNLLVNAIKYSPEGSEVIVRITKKDDRACVSVTDFGPGISREMQDVIFDRFFQADDTKRQEHSGLGLGLYISKEIIKNHGGELWVDSEVGKGSTFTFTLPLAHQEFVSV